MWVRKHREQNMSMNKYTIRKLSHTVMHQSSSNCVHCEATVVQWLTCLSQKNVKAENHKKVDHPTIGVTWGRGNSEQKQLYCHCSQPGIKSYQRPKTLYPWSKFCLAYQFTIIVLLRLLMTINFHALIYIRRKHDLIPLFPYHNGRVKRFCSAWKQGRWSCWTSTF